MSELQRSVIDAPEDVLARLDASVAGMKRLGHDRDALRYQKIADEFRVAIEPIRFVSEMDAMRRTGKSARWHRERFADWARVGGAREHHGQREYRLCCLPVSAARLAGLADSEERQRAG